MTTPARHPRLERFDAWWLRDTTPHALALLRIGLGLFLALLWLTRLPYIAASASRAGIVLPHPDVGGVLAILFLPPPAWAAQLVVAVLVASLLCVAAGMGMRVAAAVAVLLWMYEWLLSFHLFNTSFDRLFPFLLVVLACSGADRAFSIRMKMRHGSWFAWEPVSIVWQRIIAVQIAAVYLGVGWQKLWLPDWQSGEVLAWGLVGRWGTPLGFWLARQNLPMAVYDALVFHVKLFEFAMPVGLWIPGWRWIFFVWGALFHTLIALLLGIWWFLVLIPAYVVFFPPEEVSDWLERRWKFLQKEPGGKR
ncbi:MAG: HTTM domain protein [Candidatus Peregrinibacteria bacterium Gr01-1014_25]|nr:MAG: HTTM domain protein [Candidatus Peregrinibacteria bacterium Gr01-1014_25]